MIKTFQVDWHLRLLSTCQIVLIIERALGDKVVFVDTPSQADIILIGPYGTNHCSKEIQSAKGWKLFVTYEPMLPDYRYYHHSLTFCFDTFSGRNFRYPVWWLSFTLFADQTGGTYNYSTSKQILTENRPLESNQNLRREKCVTIFNKCEPRRMFWSHQLAVEGYLDGYGSAFGRPMAWGDESGYQAKHKILTEYRVNLCPENTIMDGYYTEKILHARVAGCVPVTCVDPHVSRDFDVESIINIYSEDDWKSQIQLVLCDQVEYQSRVDRPILSQAPNVNAITRFIQLSYSNYVSGNCDSSLYPEFDFAKFRPRNIVRDAYNGLRALIPK